MAGLAHDIRSPLVGVVGFAGLIKRESTEPTTRAYADKILRNADRIESLLASHPARAAIVANPLMPEGLDGILRTCGLTVDVTTELPAVVAVRTDARLVELAVRSTLLLVQTLPTATLACETRELDRLVVATAAVALRGPAATDDPRWTTARELVEFAGGKCHHVAVNGDASLEFVFEFDSHVLPTADST